MWSTIGFPAQKKYFERLLKSERLAHAYLFSGPDMIGKKKFAQEFYRTANGVSTSLEPDLLVIAPRVSEGESKIYVDDIREIVTFLSRKPFQGPYKFVVIDSAEQLTTEASNALLKVLEEPSPFSMLILVSSQSKLLLPTIASRCQEIQFAPHTREVVNSFLESKRVPTDELELTSMIADGRLGWAIRLVESDGLQDVQQAISDFQKILRQGIAERLQYAKKVYEKETYSSTVHYWLRWTHAKIGKSDAAARIVRNLMRLNYTLSQPQYNHRLALENFLVNL